ncbi:uncharacterized protein BDV17DRAFT_116390 [Aspergillus undulatus]|uniref:uncharacterized protein n=1 Tax=Aspergillus undulatus TaxID=1810928 RepID=UPI003CCE2F19
MGPTSKFIEIPNACWLANGYQLADAVRLVACKCSLACRYRNARKRRLARACRFSRKLCLACKAFKRQWACKISLTSRGSMVSLMLRHAVGPGSAVESRSRVQGDSALGRLLLLSTVRTAVGFRSGRGLYCGVAFLWGRVHCWEVVGR